MGPQLEVLTESKSNVRLVRIDIDTWRSAVARQFNIRRLPTVWLYNGSERVATDTREVFHRVTGL